MRTQGQFYGSGTLLSTLFPAVSQCGLKGNVTHLNICLNQMEYRKEINLLLSLQALHFKPQIKGLRIV